MSSDDEIDESHNIMNHCVVPDFEMDDDYPHIPFGIFTTSKIKSTIADEEIMELIWQNGQVFMQNQNQRSMRKPNLSSEQSIVEETIAASAPMFMQEDEMASLLQSPLDDSSFERDLYADFLYPTPTSMSAVPPEEIYTSTAEIRPPPPLLEPSVGTIASSSRQLIIPQLRCTEGDLTHRLQNFGHFSRLSDEAILQNHTSSSRHSVKESTVVDSNETVIAAVPEYIVSRVSNNVTPVSDVNIGGREMTATATATAATSRGREITTACELTLTPSTSGSGGSVSASPELPPPSQKAVHTAADDRKRKGRESDDNEGQSKDDVEFESADHAKKQPSSSTFTKRSRAAEVHNLSERRRRDRINEKMRALQELIPHCNKSDKASMLDEAIEYLKSLQVQVQMMSTGCSMVPMMYPGIPQYMPTMGMTMGMGMSMEMGRPMVPYPPLMLGPAMRNAAAAAQMAPRYPLPAYRLPPFPAPRPSRIPAANQPDHLRLNSLVGHNTNQPRLPNFIDPYHQYFGLQQAKLMLTQNQGVEQPSSSKLNSCIEGSTGNHQSG